MERIKFVLVLTFKDGSHDSITLFADDDADVFAIARGWLSNVINGYRIDVFKFTDRYPFHLMSYFV